MPTFSNTETVNAPASAIWARWANVAKWPIQDVSLKSASIAGPFEVGSVVTLKPKGSPTVKLRIVEVKPNKYFVAEGKLPLAALRFEHQIKPAGDKTNFTVRVIMSGPLSGFFGMMMGKKMEQNLKARMAMMVQLIEAAK